MKKKQYLFPVVDVSFWSMQELMKASGTSPDLPDDPGKTPAPRRKTEVF